MLSALPPGVFTEDGSPTLGAALLVVSACRARGLILDGDLLDAIAERVGVVHDVIRDITRFADALLASADSAAPTQVALCRGVTCTMHGAERLHPLLKSVMQRAGAAHEYKDVFCLSQCEYGPSIMVGKDIWVTRARKVVEDRREWRQGDSRPVPVSDTSAPDLD
ncbi:MAG: hypothetical protein CMJ83_02960 [Planctomycetes bacterium]|nr:hypothetical protein [Planctomycetota bacterium]